MIGVDTVNPDAQRFYERRGFRDGFHLMHGWVGGGRGGDGSGDGRSGSASGSNGSPETTMHGDD